MYRQLIGQLDIFLFKRWDDQSVEGPYVSVIFIKAGMDWYFLDNKDIGKKIFHYTNISGRKIKKEK